MAKHTMPRGLVALSVSAIAVVYATGYVHTQAADAAIAAGENAVATPVALSAPAPTAVADARLQIPDRPARETRGGDGRGLGTPQTDPSPPSQPTPIPSAASSGVTYRDGAYTGSGDSRRGGVDVQVDVESGRIARVTITRSWTQYPVSRIAALPGQVVERQSAQVDLLSRATYSAVAFRTAVQQALAKAQG